MSPKKQHRLVGEYTYWRVKPCNVCFLARLWATAHPRRGRPKRLADYGFKVISTSSRALRGAKAKAGTASKG